MLRLDRLSLPLYALLVTTGAGAGYLANLGEPASPGVAGAGTPRQAAAPPSEARTPVATDLSPAEVVDAQMRGLTACRLDRAAIADVFAHASPANKAVTGPLERFEKMVWRPPFDRLVGAAGWTVGEAVVREGVAAVLVVAISEQGVATPFRFFLSQQSGEHEGRWMTDGVFPVAPNTNEPTI